MFLFDSKNDSFLINNHNQWVLDLLKRTEKEASISYKKNSLIDPALHYYSFHGKRKLNLILDEVKDKKIINSSLYFDNKSSIALNYKIENIPREKNKAKIDSSLGVLKSFYTVLNNHAYLNNLVKRYIHSICFLKPNNNIPYSGSISSCIGMAWVTSRLNMELTGEMFIHEAAHSKLFTFQEYEEIHVTSDHEFWEINQYTSPWREDRRPLGGLLHGIYVFYHVLLWYEYLIRITNKKELSKIILPRFSLVYLQLNDAINQINKNGISKLNNHGLEIINTVKNYLSRKQRLIAKLDIHSISFYPIDQKVSPKIYLKDKYPSLALTK